MTTIIFEPDFPRMRFKGHAGSGPYGQDLVCAAVSTLAGTLAAALEEWGIGADVTQGDGDVSIQAKPTLQQWRDAALIFETIEAGAELLEKKYPEHVNTMRT